MVGILVEFLYGLLLHSKIQQICLRYLHAHVIQSCKNYTKLFLVFIRKSTDTYRKIQHAILMDKVVGPIDMFCVLQVAVVNAGICEAAWQVCACQRFMWHLWDRHLAAELPHVLTEKVCIAYIEGCQSGVEGRNRDGGDLRSHWEGKRKISVSLVWT